MVKISTNTTNTSPIQVTPCADFCINSGLSHTFDVGIRVTDNQQSAKLENFEMVVELSVVKATNVTSVSEYSSAGLVISTNSENKTATITDGKSMEGSVEIPAIVKDENNVAYTVTTIGDLAFYKSGKGQYTPITDVVIPNSVTTIESYAFRGCKDLTKVVIKSGVTTIGSGAFYSCTSLVDIAIPSSVTTIGSSAFESCGSLVEIAIPNSVTTIDANVFQNCTQLVSVIIPNSVTTIGNSMFSGCSSLVEIVIPSGVTTIGNQAFYNCISLVEISIPNNVTTIGDRAFENCAQLASVAIPSSVTTIGYQAFYKCSNLTSITVSAITPPDAGSSCFANTNDCPIYVPADSVETYKTAAYWGEYASRIQAIA